MRVICIHICVNDGSKYFFGEQHGEMIVVEIVCFLVEDVAISVGIYGKKDQVLFVSPSLHVGYIISCSMFWYMFEEIPK